MSKVVFPVLRWYGYMEVVGGLHLELVHRLAGVGDHDLITVAVSHDISLLFIRFCFKSDGTSTHSFASNNGDIPAVTCTFIC